MWLKSDNGDLLTTNVIHHGIYMKGMSGKCHTFAKKCEWCHTTKGFLLSIRSRSFMKAQCQFLVQTLIIGTKWNPYSELLSPRWVFGMKKVTMNISNLPVSAYLVQVKCLYFYVISYCKLLLP